MDKQIPHGNLNPLDLQSKLNFGREGGKFQKEEKVLDSFAAFSEVKAQHLATQAPAWKYVLLGSIKTISQIKAPVFSQLQAQHHFLHV